MFTLFATSKMSRNIAIILAGGSGGRFGAALPKQFVEVAGKKIIEHTVDVFEGNSHIDEIAIVCREEDVSDVRRIVAANGYRKVRKILTGGKERYHSSLSAIRAYEDDDDNLIFHDAVRPLVSDRIIDDCVRALDSYPAVNVAVMTTDTIIQVDDRNCITDIPYRPSLRNVQTPQCFRREVIRRAYDLALRDPQFVTTDDCGVVKKYLADVPIYVVPGETSNIKVTYRQDLYLLECLLSARA